MTVEKIVKGLRQVGRFILNNGKNETVCTGGLLLNTLHEEIPEVAPHKMPSTTMMAEEFQKIFKGITVDEAQKAASTIIMNNDSKKEDLAFAELQRLLETYENPLVLKFIPNHFRRVEAEKAWLAKETK